MTVPAIELIDVHTELGGTPVLRGVSFAALPGRITVLLGPSGVGKTTSLRHVVGLLTPDRGDVLVEGRSTLTMSNAKRLALSRRFGVLLQGSGLYGSALWESMTVEENLMHQLQAQVDWGEEELFRRSHERLREVGLADSAQLTPADLSAGMRRRVALARALVADPDFAVLDSFELGVDVVRLMGLCDVIRRRHDEIGGTYLIATQNMEVARRLADDVVVLWGGQVIEEGPADEVLVSSRSEVHQLVNGTLEGPLGMGGEVHFTGQPLRRSRGHAEEGFDVPLPAAVFALLVVVSASTLILGGGHPVELAIVVGVWVVSAMLLALRHLRRRR
ncbi:MAG TPA: ATP-binding cassette domain-containing protein [Solirubrobacteraceae bacterium]|nr:ATP-binding cassette domain-containing protein [Solirubrobacteraceae bacterium]